jgi:hypothetical protein
MAMTGRADEQGYFDTWDAYNLRLTWERDIENGGDRTVDRLPAVSPLDALAANRRLVDLLTLRRWYVMQAAREAGATWEQIGSALGMSKQGAYDWYKKAIAAEKQLVKDLYDAPRAQAALND